MLFLAAVAAALDTSAVDQKALHEGEAESSDDTWEYGNHTWSGRNVDSEHEHAKVVYTGTDGKSLAFCACGKCGTTSLLGWLSQSVYGHPLTNPDTLPGQSKHDKPIHDVMAWPTPPKGSFKDHAAYDPNTTTTYHLYRDPLDRYRSAWQSKLRCATPSRLSENFARRLLEMAGMDVDKYGKHRNKKAVGERHGFYEGGMVWCLEFRDFARALRKVHAKGLRRKLNDHFLPQDVSWPGCSIGQSTKLTVTEFAAQSPQIARRFGLHEITFPHEQVSEGKRTLVGEEMEEVSDAELARQLCAIVEPEYKWLKQEHIFAEKCAGPYKPLARPSAD